MRRLRSDTLRRGLQWCALLSAARECAAAGGQSIFKLGSEIDVKNWDVMGMYFVVFGVTICFELAVIKVEESCKSESAKHVSHHVTQEIMILGGISAVLVVFENLGGTAVIDAPLFHYVHFVIFLMAIIFISLVSSLFLTVDRAWEKWTRFELKVDEIETDPSLTYEAKAAFLQHYVKNAESGQQMLSSIIFFRQNLPGPFTDVEFNRYMKKMQRKWLLSFLQLHESSWGLLGLLCFFAAIVTYITLQVSENEVATIGLWTLFVGFGPLLVLVVTFFKVRREYQLFNYEVQEMRYRGLLRPANPQKRHFWWGMPHRMAQVMQTMLMYQVFFIANASANFTSRLVGIGKYGWMLLFACFLPTIVVFFLMMPLVMPPFTILASLGDFLDHDTLLRMKVSDRKSGRFRRQQDRDALILEPARFIVDDVASITRAQVKTLRKEAKEDVSLPLLAQDRADAIEIFRHGRSSLCEECDEPRRPTTMYCPVCDVSLCEECDGQMHVLKKLSTHRRTQVGAGRRRPGERRVDVVDGDVYSYEEFVEEYGDEAPIYWERSAPAPAAPRPAPGAPPRPADPPPPPFNPAVISSSLRRTTVGRGAAPPAPGAPPDLAYPYIARHAPRSS
eukprot:TRINITY_DN1574_c0_g1_i2.p1 TRINITY_DN1574_c0_g1~~TRINITY_DN1574_c0_g1_i2.p1  ORF type:complete len:645 (+),score=202.91 TRINITY_DN1574_c0_g1_i2:82-1935(+)